MNGTVRAMFSITCCPMRSMMTISVCFACSGPCGAQWSPFEFPPAVYDLPAASTPRNVAPGDFNDDGIVDLAIAGGVFNTGPDSPEPRVWILPGLGNGEFGRAIDEIIPITFNNTELTWLVAGDWNSDGHLDLAVCSEVPFVYIRLGNGDFTFEPADNSFTGISSLAAHAVDVDLDGDLDLVGAGFLWIWSTGAAFLARNDGEGDFDDVTELDIDFAGYVHFMTAGDFTGDGYPDCAVASQGADRLSIFINDGGGNYGDAVVIDYSSEYAPTGVTACDLDLDGDVDLVTANPGGSITLVQNQGDGTFVGPLSMEIKDGPVKGNWPWYIASADLNADGAPDLAYTDPVGSMVRVLWNDLQDPGSLESLLPIPTDGFPNSLSLVNVDSDCDFDVVLANLWGDSISVIRNDSPDDWPCAFFDLNGDTLVDGGDVSALLDCWHDNASPADLNYDGIVDQADLAFLLSNWDGK